MPGKVKIETAATVAWTDELVVTVTDYARSETPWIRGEAEQDGALVWAQYARASEGALTVGPTPAGDESKPADGRVAVGYWTRQGTFREVASVDFDVTPAP